MLQIIRKLPLLVGPLGWGMVAAIIALGGGYAWCVHCILGTC